MKVVLAESAGFCRGVRRAVDKARALVAQGHSVYTDGPLIHNEQMMQKLHSEGIIVSQDPSSLADDDLIIRAHGIPPDRREMLRKTRARLVDATCPDVAKIQGLIRKHARSGYFIIVFGDKGHAEVTGLLGYTEGKGYVVNSTRDINNLPDISPICLVSQSTQFPLDYEEVANTIRARFPDTVVLDTICESTKNRQNELVNMAASVDAIVVVGGSHSANTVRLVELARTLKTTFHIQTAEQIKPELLRDYKIIGLTAGASTPKFIIEEIQQTLEKI